MARAGNRLRCDKFVDAVADYEPLATERGLRLWWKRAATIHVKLIAGARTLVEWWPATGKWVAISGASGKADWFTEVLDVAIREQSTKTPEVGAKCPLCSGSMEKRLGKYGAFYSCRRYPDCSGSLNLRQAEHGAPIDTESKRAEAREQHDRHRTRSERYNARAETPLAEWRAAMIDADTTTEPPFDLTGDAPEPCEVDREFAAMFE